MTRELSSEISLRSVIKRSGLHTISFMGFLQTSTKILHASGVRLCAILFISFALAYVRSNIAGRTALKPSRIMTCFERDVLENIENTKSTKGVVHRNTASLKEAHTALQCKGLISTKREVTSSRVGITLPILLI